jgi:hypothetical protein
VDAIIYLVMTLSSPTRYLGEAERAVNIYQTRHYAIHNPKPTAKQTLYSEILSDTDRRRYLKKVTVLVKETKWGDAKTGKNVG